MREKRLTDHAICGKQFDETTDEHGASIFVSSAAAGFTKMAAFGRPITLESRGIAVALLSQRGNSQAGENAMQLESHEIVKARLESCCLG